MTTKQDDQKECAGCECAGCERSRGKDGVAGGIIHLPGGWILNHYQGDEGFFGWMALQPYEHRCEFKELTKRELQTLGENIQNVDVALQDYWKGRFPNDPIKRVYVVYFYESVYDEPKPTRFHLHIHLIPRTRKLDMLLREYTQPDSDQSPCRSTIVAWNIHEVAKHADFPEEYRYDRNKRKHKREAARLMKYLRNQLEED